MLVEDAQMLASLRQIVARFTRCPELQQDLMQECLLHLWKLERKKPGHTRSWYLQGCRFHLQHCLVSGRSLDSLKRANGVIRIDVDGGAEEPALDEHHTNGEVFEAVSFADVVSTLRYQIMPRERQVLSGLADGMMLQEIAAEFGISYPTVLKCRRKIAALTIKLGIDQAPSPLKHNGYSAPRCKVVTRGAAVQKTRRGD